MSVGHLAVGFMGKRAYPRPSLATYFVATELPDFLHRDDWVCRKRYAIRSASFGVGHVHREVALVLPLEKKKVKACSTLNVL